MKYEQLPYKFELHAWLYWIESLELLSFRPSFIIPQKIKTLLEYVRDHWDYWSDQRFFRTCSLIMLTGCRISEIPSIGYGNTPDGMVIHLYAKKQRVERYIETTLKACETVGLMNFHKGTPTLTEREFNRRFKRYFPSLKTIAKDHKILSGSHVFRHLFVSALVGVSGRSEADVMNLMKWSNKQLMLDYTALLR
jgi:integrase